MQPPNAALQALRQLVARARWALLLAGLLPVTPAAALAPELQLQQLHHIAWLTRDGAPSDIQAITQTPDGFLWLGTSSGLFRFDGMQFERIDLFPKGDGPGQAQNIATLALGRDGALWVGFTLAGVMRLPTPQEGPGAAHRWYDWNSGLPIGTVFALLPGAQGQVWAATSRGLFTLNGARWEPASHATGSPSGPIFSLLEDADGAIWLKSQADRWYRRRAGAPSFEFLPALDGVADVAIGPNGRRWMLETEGPLRLEGLDGAGRWPTGLPRGGAAVLADRDGALWIGHGSAGLLRVPAPGQTRGTALAMQTMNGNSGLSSSRVQCIYEDRHGHLWLGTAAGLDHFRPPRAVVMPFANGATGGVLVPGTDGSVIAASNTESPVRMRPHLPVQPLRGDYPTGNVWFGAGWRDPDGSVWLGSAPDLWREAGGQLQRLAAPPEAQPNRPVQTIARDANGTLWVAWVPGPLRRFTDPGWAPPAPAERQEIVMVTHAAADGGFWRGLASGELIRRSPQGSEQRWGRDEGLALGMVLSVLPQPGRVWVGGELGAAVQIGTRFVPLRVQAEQPLRTVSGIVMSQDGALWLNDESGILRIGPAPLQAWLAKPDAPVPVTRLDWRDGVLGASPQIRQLPSAVVGSDGRLWFSRHQGIYWVDPTRSTAAVTPPPTQVTGLWADGKPVALGAETELPVAPQVVRITYTAPLPGAARLLTYRVRLLGLDDRWQDVGARREQVFNRLPPGDYRLELQALLGENGSSAVTQLAFSVPPALHQTVGFRALLGLLAVAVGAALYRWRVAVNCRRMQERIEARLAERERIARELHDTLLQGTQALSLQIEASLQDLPVDDPRRLRLSRALDRADATLVDARERVQDLRRHQQPGELALALREAIELMRGDAAVPIVRAECLGRERPLVNAIWHEAFRLGLEAAQNALQHAQATLLTVQVQYGADALVLTVTDDGIGLPAATGADGDAASTAAAPGHFGLRGLQERARLMGATLDIRSRTGHGTTIQLRVRASGAYVSPAPWRGWWPARRRATPAASEPR
jgi:signal transduction histidine kinase/ligand-binding sensor domain-containing protein